ncbi:unnamed protein product [Zymoseptoria tritici ST99CH_3D7]|uniref:Autophagy-related protein 17 n=1 Tax=Zymoseptoria tritici (strain ST99CH_3D7) TaxID=1276538 RepID=A0A1X7RQS6_ZYMT9|nr:unnamed protein product [Zymoseptoria tritici ST99CH_3D7]
MDSSDEDSSSRSASPSPSPPPQSPEASYQGPPSLERLVIHFVSSKRSLTSTAHVYRANELVTTSRALIEELAVLNAKNAFARRGLEEQVDTLAAIRDAVSDDGDLVANDFDATVADLDKAHNRLDKTLQVLRKTIVDAQHVSHNVDEGSEASDEEEKKTLYDFIDESNHEEILSSIRGLIDTYHIARGDLETPLSAFDRSLKTIRTTLSTPLSLSEEDIPPDKPTIYDQQSEPPNSSLPSLFHSMNSHATALASLLENLIKHYDLCVTALKHTEGGGEAAKNAMLAQDLSKLAAPGSEESLYRTTHPEPISSEHRLEMLHVLENDAVEVEDVVVEMKDHAAEMESAYSSLSTSVRQARAEHKSLQHVLAMLHSVRAAVPSYLTSATRFRSDWTDISGGMHSKTKDLVELCGFYDHFLSGYGKLLREVERRRTSEAQMRRVVERARREIERVAEVDDAAREAFMEDVGSFLPRDLGAWFGLEEAAERWEVRAVFGLGEGEGTRLMDG